MTRMVAAAAVLFTLLLAVAPASTAAGPDKTAPFAACEAAVRRSPHEQQSYLCFYLEARRRGLQGEAERRLERIGRQPDADRHWPRLFLALLAAETGQPRAERLFEESANAFMAGGDPAGVVLTRLALARFLRLRSRIDDAERQATMAESIASPIADAVLSARVAVERAFIAYNKGDYGRAWRLLKEVESTTFTAGPLIVRSSWLSAMGATCWATGRRAEALGAYRRQVELLHEAGELYEEVGARDNVLLLLSGDTLSREELARAAHANLAAAEKVGNREAQARALLYLAEATSGEAALTYARKALTMARRSAPGSMAMARRATAARLVLFEPGEAFRLIDEGISDATRRGDLGEVARNWVVRSDMRWRTGPRSMAVADSMRSIEAAEAIRHLQPEALVRARRFSAWSAPFNRLIGHLLSGDLRERGQPSEPDLELTFSVMERRRARMLLDELDAGGASALGAAQPSRAPSFPSLRELRAALAQDESVFAFQLRGTAGDPNGNGSTVPSAAWLLVHTRGGTRTYEIPGSIELDSTVALFGGLFARRDGSERLGAQRLYSMLLQRAIADLPPEIMRLILVPDAMLFSVPFAALRDGRDQQLAERFEISTVPSATAWLALRRAPNGSRGAAALALADPELEVNTLVTTDARLRDATELGRLPQARREVAALRHSFADATVLLGREASEHFIKRADLRGLGLVHIAAHGLVDSADPDRSAILLAPGSGDEDGLLQVPEIVKLKLAGVVVLSACRSASGAVLNGEGVMGLAHAFFQAGAHTVVASLWPLRDDEAAEIFRTFYDQLGRGLSVNAAVRAARQDAISNARPGAAWAGLVVLGNGEIVPIPGGMRFHRRFQTALLITVSSAFVLFALGLLARRRSRPTRDSLA